MGGGGGGGSRVKQKRMGREGEGGEVRTRGKGHSQLKSLDKDDEIVNKLKNA